jgi:hypothetical protein
MQEMEYHHAEAEKDTEVEKEILKQKHKIKTQKLQDGMMTKPEILKTTKQPDK